MGNDTAWLMTPLEVPLHIVLEPSNRCNAGCPFCQIHVNRRRARELPDERWLELADEICQMGIQDVGINSSRGEPLMRRELLLQLMAKFSKAGITGNIITNGTLISDDFARKAVELQWHAIEVSVHAPTAQLADEHMGLRGAFRNAMKGVESLNRWKGLLRSDAPELHLRIVLTGKNFTQLPAYVRFAKSKGAAVVKVRRVVKAVPLLDDSFWIPKRKENQFGKIIREAKRIADDIGLGIEFDFDAAPYLREKRNAPIHSSRKNGHENIHCPVPFSELYIFGNGIVGTCPEFVSWQFKDEGTRRGIMEDISEQPLSRIWREGFSRLRSSRLENMSKDIPCVNCSAEGGGVCTLKSEWPESFLNQRAMQLRAGEEYEKGIRFYIEQLRQFPDNATIHHHLGEFHMELGEYGTAIGYLRRAAELDETMGWTRFSLGKCYFLTGRLKEAGQALRQNLNLTSDRSSHYHSWLLLAVCHWAFKEYKERDRCLAEAARLMDALKRSERWDEEQFRRFKARWPAPFFDEAFRHLRRQGQYREGIRLGLDLLKEHPDHPALLHHIGEFHMELGEYGTAIGYLRRAAELDETMEWTRFSLGKCYYLTKQYSKAEKVLRANITRTAERLAQFHSLLFLAMTADARKDKKGCREALEAVQEFRDCIGSVIPSEKDFFERLKREHLLPDWLVREHSKKAHFSHAETQSNQ